MVKRKKSARALFILTLIIVEVGRTKSCNSMGQPYSPVSQLCKCAHSCNIGVLNLVEQMNTNFVKKILKAEELLQVRNYKSIFFGMEGEAYCALEKRSGV